MLQNKRFFVKQEVEVKIKISSLQLDILKEWLGKNATFVGQTNHKDVYLDNPNDSFFFTDSEGKKNALRFFRVRLTDKDEYSACYKNWHVDKCTGKTTHCDEIEVKLVDGMQTLELLKAIGFTDKQVREKSRKKYLFDSFEIVIDNIKKDTIFNGIFVEIELNHQIDDVEAGIQSIYALLRDIGITTFKRQISGCGKMEKVNL